MAVHSAQIRVSTEGNGDIIDITQGVQEVVETAGIKDGIVNVFVAHSTAAVSLIEYEPGGVRDMQELMDRLVPAGRRLQPQPDGGRHERPLAPPGRDRGAVRDRAGQGRPPRRRAPGSSSCWSTSTTIRASGRSWSRCSS